MISNSGPLPPLLFPPSLQCVKAYLRRGTSKESLFSYKEALEGQDLMFFSA